MFVILELHKGTMSHKIDANKDYYQCLFAFIIDSGIKFNSVFHALDHNLSAKYRISFAKIFDLHLNEFLSLLQRVVKLRKYL